MKADFIKGMKLAVKPILYFNTLLGVLPAYFLLKIHWMLAFHVIMIYANFFLMGYLIIEYAESKGWL